MVYDLFSSLTQAMTNKFAIVLAASFGWGIASILLNTYHLASIPLVVGYIVKRRPASARRSVGLR